jgi:peptidoglycan-N-acetylglucosamine deacetylase
MPSSWAPSFHTYHNLPSPPTVDTTPQHPWIALTFDDGPHPVMTEKLLAVLHQAHVPATFFVVGKMADRYPELVREIARDGHELANHTYTHPNLANLSNDAILSELDRTRETILRLTGQDTYLFRPPGGDYSRRMIRLTENAGYRMVLWDILTRDVEGASPQMMRWRILRGAEDGAVVLMHSGIKNTLDTLPEVISLLQQEGYHFVTVSTLFKQTHRSQNLPPESSPAWQTASLPSE